MRMRHVRSPMGARHANKRSSAQRVRDRAEIAERYLRGEPQRTRAASS
jgi:hypothetical protein